MYNNFARRNQTPPGNLFPDSDEYPDYEPIPRITLAPEYQSLRTPVVGMVMAVTFVGLCPAIHERHEHVPHQEQPLDLHYMRAAAVSSTSVNSLNFVRRL